LLIRHSKYSAIFSKIHTTTDGFFGDFAPLGYYTKSANEIEPFCSDFFSRLFVFLIQQKMMTWTYFAWTARAKKCTSLIAPSGHSRPR